MPYYNVEKIFKKAKKEIEERKLFFVEDVISYLPITKPTFYDYFKVGSNEFNEIKDLLDKNRMDVKISMRNKWYKSENATLQMGLMKLICTDEERRMLSHQYNENKNTQSDSIKIEIID